jgi:hypothetical protein
LEELQLPVLVPFVDIGGLARLDGRGPLDEGGHLPQLAAVQGQDEDVIADGIDDFLFVARESDPRLPFVGGEKRSDGSRLEIHKLDVAAFNEEGALAGLVGDGLGAAAEAAESPAAARG